MQRDEVRASYEQRFKGLSEELNVTRLKLADSERLVGTLRVEMTQSSERASRSLAEVLLLLELLIRSADTSTSLVPEPYVELLVEALLTELVTAPIHSKLVQ